MNLVVSMVASWFKNIGVWGGFVANWITVHMVWLCCLSLSHVLPFVSCVSCLASIKSIGWKENDNKIGMTASVLQCAQSRLSICLLPSQLGHPQEPCAGSPLPRLGGASSLFSSPKTLSRNWPPSTTLGPPWSGTRDKRYLSFSLTGTVSKTEPKPRLGLKSTQS